MKIRLGNDIKGLEWEIKRKVLVDGVITALLEDFTECLEINVMVFHSKIRTEKIKVEYVILEGTIILNIPANTLKELGSYNIVLEYKIPDPSLAGGVGTHTLDWKDAFVIVASTEQQDACGSVNTSTINYSIDGKTAYEYWLDYNTGSVEDYVNWQQRPAVEAAVRVDSFITNSQATIDALSELMNGLQTDLSALKGEPQEIQQFESYLNFPNLGNSRVLYIDMEEDIAYRWDEDNLKYYKINEIEIINGGN